MAQSLDFDVPKAQTKQTAEEEWADVLETLHETETLRVLHGLVGQYEGVQEVVLNQLLATDTGHAAAKNLAALFNALTAIETDDLEVLSDGLGKGFRAARRSFESDDAPGLIRLFARLRDPDVRRALAALLALLKGFGSHLDENVEPEPAKVEAGSRRS